MIDPDCYYLGRGQGGPRAAFAIGAPRNRRIINFEGSVINIPEDLYGPTITEQELYVNIEINSFDDKYIIVPSIPESKPFFGTVNGTLREEVMTESEKTESEKMLDWDDAYVFRIIKRYQQNRKGIDTLALSIKYGKGRKEKKGRGEVMYPEAFLSVEEYVNAYNRAVDCIYGKNILCSAKLLTGQELGTCYFNAAVNNIIVNREIADILKLVISAKMERDKFKWKHWKNVLDCLNMEGHVENMINSVNILTGSEFGIGGQPNKVFTTLFDMCGYKGDDNGMLNFPIHRVDVKENRYKNIPSIDNYKIRSFNMIIYGEGVSHAVLLFESCNKWYVLDSNFAINNIDVETIKCIDDLNDKLNFLDDRYPKSKYNKSKYNKYKHKWYFTNMIYVKEDQADTKVFMYNEHEHSFEKILKETPAPPSQWGGYRKRKTLAACCVLILTTAVSSLLGSM